MMHLVISILIGLLAGAGLVLVGIVLGYRIGLAAVRGEDLTSPEMSVFDIDEEDDETDETTSEGRRL